MGLLDRVEKVPNSRTIKEYSIKDEWVSVIDKQRRLLKGENIKSFKKNKKGEYPPLRSWFKDKGRKGIWFIPSISNIPIFGGGIKLRVGEDQEKVLDTFEKEWKNGEYEDQVKEWNKTRIKRNEVLKDRSKNRK